MDYCNACNLCLEENLGSQNIGSQNISATAKQYIEPKFLQFVRPKLVQLVGYCYNLVPITVVALTTESMSVPTTLPDGRVSNITVTRITITPIVALQENSSSVVKSISGTTAISGSSSTVATTSGGISSSHTPAPTLATNTVTDQQAGTNVSIVGPVVGAEVAAIIIAVGLLCFIRKKQKGVSADPETLFEKAQLHGDSLEKPLPHELCAREFPCAEMTASGLACAEMVVNEVAAVELPAESKAGDVVVSHVSGGEMTFPRLVPRQMSWGCALAKRMSMATLQNSLFMTIVGAGLG